jgi:hypothetical protein
MGFRAGVEVKGTRDTEIQGRHGKCEVRLVCRRVAVGGGRKDPPPSPGNQDQDSPVAGTLA